MMWYTHGHKERHETKIHTGKQADTETETQKHRETKIPTDRAERQRETWTHSKWKASSSNDECTENALTIH